MAVFNHSNFNININPPIAPNSQISIDVNPHALFQLGFNIPIEISIASAFKQATPLMPFKSIIVMAHFDTGASITSIDTQLAQHLNLAPTGFSTANTAAGPQRLPTYAVDIFFPGTTLKPMINLNTGSCKLGFNIQNCISNPSDPRNFGILLGRDIMANWVVIWNGTSSQVTISD